MLALSMKMDNAQEELERRFRIGANEKGQLKSGRSIIINGTTRGFCHDRWVSIPILKIEAQLQPHQGATIHVVCLQQFLPFAM